MAQYKIHPIVTVTKVFDQGMMTYQHAYDVMLTIKEMADILIPLHEPGFASVSVIP